MNCDGNVIEPEAREIVLAAYNGFTPRMAEIAGRFFERNWIDARTVRKLVRPVTPAQACRAYRMPILAEVGK